MIRVWNLVGTWLLGSVGRASQIGQGIVVSTDARSTTRRAPETMLGAVPQIRPAFTVVEGGRREQPRPTQPHSPTRRAG